MKLKSFLVIISLLVFFSCDYQKRLYRKGFYVHWNRSRSDVHKQSLSCSVQEKNSNPVGYKPEAVLISSDGKDWTSILNKIKDDTCGDTLVLKSGEELVVKILEISDDEIKYKRCDYLNGPTYVIKKNKIYMIKYFNGTREHILPENIPPSADKKEHAGEIEYDYGYQTLKQKEYSSDKNDKQLPPPSLLVYAYIALVAGIFISFLPFANSLLLTLANLLLIGSLFWSRQAKRIILENTGKYKGLGWANFLMYFNLVMWILSLILLIMLLNVVNSSYKGIITVAIFLTLLILLIFFVTSRKSDF